MAEGAIVALLGANGAGKTTTLKAISSLVRAECGKVVQGGIRFRGESIVDADAAGLVRRGIVQVLEGRRCFAHLTVEENILSGGFVNRPSRRALAADLERVYTFQLVHLATLTGIGRAASADVARLVAERRRTYTHANGPRPAQDPQVLQIVGRVRGAVYGAGAITLRAAEAVQRAFDAHRAGDAEAEDHAVAIAELEVSQSLTVVSDLVLGAVTLLFDALGASATSRRHSLDRYWRNARTLASHNPRIYKDRIVGDFAVNGTIPPPQWRIGLPETLAAQQGRRRG